ncbi:MAG: polysaccharide deacetylase family protein [Geoalkalibacter sp.]|uniref:polysaccharide deacetylase family protein n=1 Tax=Geoalkalibacter sp. TaxID=3041440 RepID=UPI003D0C51C3
MKMHWIDSLTERYAVLNTARNIYCGFRSRKNAILNILDKPVIVLLYHRVADLDSDPERLAVSPTHFREQMNYLKEHYRIVRFEGDWSGLQEPAVAVTFDDGYADNFYEALPILEETGVPATFFVSTCYLGTLHEFWWHQLECLLLREGRFPLQFELNDSRCGRSWPTSTLLQRKSLYCDLNELMQRIEPARREAWLVHLRDWAGQAHMVQSGLNRLMTPGELRRLAASPQVTIGAHTVTHTALSGLSEVQQRNEIMTSKETLERMTGDTVQTFSYPFGTKNHYNRKSVRICREAGFLKAASNFPGQIHRWSDPYQLPRHLVRNWCLDMFIDKMRGFWIR